MAGSTSDNGTQQISIYPYQPLSTSKGNEILQGVLVPGVSNAKVTVSTGSGAVLNFTIAQGTQLVFQRTGANSETIIGKITLGTDAVVSSDRVTLWTNVTYSNSQALYLVADWTFSMADSTRIYVQFSLVTDAGLATIKNADGTASHSLVIATILNNKYYVTNYNAGTYLTMSLAYYHFSYDSQTQRGPLERLYNANDDFVVDHDPNGRGVFVEKGNLVTNGTVIAWNPTFDTLSTAPTPVYYPGRANALGTLATGQIVPAVGLTSMVNQTTGASVSIVGYETSYYQIDFLRLKSDDVTHAVAVVWESFLRPAPGATLASIPSSGFFTAWGATGASTPLDFASFSNMTQTNLRAYLTSLPAPYNQFPLSGEGLTLLVSIRLRGASSTTWSAIPTTDGNTNVTWPENCIPLHTTPFARVGMAPSRKRFKIPVWQATDIGQ